MGFSRKIFEQLASKFRISFLGDAICIKKICSATTRFIAKMFGITKMAIWYHMHWPDLFKRKKKQSKQFDLAIAATTFLCTDITYQTLDILKILYLSPQKKRQRNEKKKTKLCAKTEFWVMMLKFTWYFTYTESEKEKKVHSELWHHAHRHLTKERKWLNYQVLCNIPINNT